MTHTIHTILIALGVAAALLIGDWYIRFLIKRSSRIWHQEKYEAMRHELDTYPIGEPDSAPQ